MFDLYLRFCRGLIGFKSPLGFRTTQALLSLLIIFSIFLRAFRLPSQVCFSNSIKKLLSFEAFYSNPFKNLCQVSDVKRNTSRIQEDSSSISFNSCLSSLNSEKPACRTETVKLNNLDLTQIQPRYGFSHVVLELL